MTHGRLQRLGLVVGVTGHRHLRPERIESLHTELTRLMTALRDLVSGISGGQGTIRVLSQFAAGTDQVAARLALDAGLLIGAVLPFDRQHVLATLEPKARTGFAELEAQAGGCVWHLPGGHAEDDRGYMLAGEAMLAEADLLIAVWDGKSANGPGGTADVVASAVRRGVPVLHVRPELPTDTTIVWSGLTGLLPELLGPYNPPTTKLTDAILEKLIEHLVAPPRDDEECAALERFMAEPERRRRLRPEYALLLALTGVRPFSWPRRSAKAATGFPTAAADDGTKYLEQSFARADALADHFGELYRGSVIFNYFAAAAAVLLALLGPVWPPAKPYLVLGELVLILTLIVNTHVGNRRQWHQRWLDYRYLAETIRLMPNLKRLCTAGHPRGTTDVPRVQRWMDWYATALWRAAGPPPSLASQGAVDAVREDVLHGDVEPQITYHRKNAARMRLLDHRLHRMGSILFTSTALVSVWIAAGYVLPFRMPHLPLAWSTLLAAGLPTIGAAMFGMRAQLDLVGTAARSEQTADALQPAADRLGQTGLLIAAVAAATDAAATVMLRDLADWRVSYSERKLAIPA